MRIHELLKSRSVVAAVGCLALVALMGTSVASVRAQDPQSTQEQEQERAEMERVRHMRALEEALAAAKHTIAANQEHLERRAREVHRLAQSQVEDRLRAMQDAGRLRMRALPRVDFRNGPGWRGRGGAESILAQAEELELSDSQQEQIRTASKAARRSDIERDAAIEVAELDLEDLMEDADSADLGAVEAKMKEIANLRVAARIADLRLGQQVRGVLTPEQRDKLEDLDHNVFIWRDGDGPSTFSFRRNGEGPSAFGFHREGDRLHFGPGALGEFEFDEDFPFGLFELKRKAEAGEKREKSEGEQGAKVEGVKTL